MMTDASFSDGLGPKWERYLRLVAERPELFAQRDELEIVLDEHAAEEFEARTGRTLGVVYESPYSMMLVDLVRDSSGHEYAYERLVPAATGPAVVTVPVCGGKYVLVTQFRHSMRSLQVGLPRGYGEDGLSAEENAAKELSEELGADVVSSEVVGHVVANSGVSGGRVAVVLCELGSHELREGHEGIVGVRAVTAGELREMIATGQIDDGFTLAAWALLEAAGRV